MPLTDAELIDLVDANLPSGTGNPNTGAGIRAANHRDTLQELIGAKVSIVDGVPDGYLLLLRGPGNTGTPPQNGDAGLGYIGTTLGIWRYEAGAWVILQNFEP
jgi:hypothetical protein